MNLMQSIAVALQNKFVKLKMSKLHTKTLAL